MENQAPFNEHAIYTICEVAGTKGVYEGRFDHDSPYPGEQKFALVRFIANLYDQNPELPAVIANCINPNSKISRLCVVPMSAIMEPSNDGSKKQAVKSTGKRTK